MNKRIVVLAFLLLAADAGFAQSGELPDTSGGVIRTEQNLKTGNYLDVLTNFFQLAAQDLTGPDKSFQFKSTLFGIKARGNESLHIDRNYRQQRFARNLQFELGLHTDQAFKVQGVSGGITYALINNRDKSRADFRNTGFNDVAKKYLEARTEAESAYRESLRLKQESTVNYIGQIDSELEQIKDPARIASLTRERELLQNQRESIEVQQRKFAVAAKEFDEEDGKLDNMPEEVLTAYNSSSMPALKSTADSIYKALMLEIAARGLLTIAAHVRTDSASRKFNEGNLDLVYLKGLGSRNIEADIRGNLNYKDTLTPDGKHQLAFHLVGGANFILWKDKRDNRSLLEVKPNLEFRSVLSRQYPNQDNFFSFNMDIRLRITDQIWLPVVVKYDIEHKNLLGFLNVSINMDAFKGFSQSLGQ